MQELIDALARALGLAAQSLTGALRTYVKWLLLSGAVALAASLLWLVVAAFSGQTVLSSLLLTLATLTALLHLAIGSPVFLLARTLAQAPGGDSLVRWLRVLVTGLTLTVAVASALPRDVGGNAFVWLAAGCLALSSMLWAASVRSARWFGAGVVLLLSILRVAVPHSFERLVHVVVELDQRQAAPEPVSMTLEQFEQTPWFATGPRGEALPLFWYGTDDRKRVRLFRADARSGRTPVDPQTGQPLEPVDAATRNAYRRQVEAERAEQLEQARAREAERRSSLESLPRNPPPPVVATPAPTPTPQAVPAPPLEPAVTGSEVAHAPSAFVPVRLRLDPDEEDAWPTVDLPAGTFRVTALGEVCAAGRVCFGATGSPWAPREAGVRPVLYLPLSSARFGALLADLDEGPPRVVDRRRSWRLDQAGRLRFRLNVPPRVWIAWQGRFQVEVEASEAE